MTDTHDRDLSSMAVASRCRLCGASAPDHCDEGHTPEEELLFSEEVVGVLLDLLEDVEWAGRAIPQGQPMCPICKVIDICHFKEHQPYCRLAAALRAGKRRPVPTPAEPEKVPQKPAESHPEAAQRGRRIRALSSEECMEGMGSYIDDYLRGK